MGEKEKFYIVNGKQIPLKRVLSANSIVPSNKEYVRQLAEELANIPDVEIN